MEHQPGLKGRHRPDIVQSGEVVLPAFDLLLVDRDQGNVRRRQTARIRSRRVRDESVERTTPQFRELRDVRPVEHSAGKGERCCQAGPVDMVLNRRVDFDHGRHSHGRVLGSAKPSIALHRQPVLCSVRGADPAQIVETDLRRTESAEWVALARQVPQHPESDSMIGDRTHVFLDGFESPSGVGATCQCVVDVDSAEVHAHRVERGEPTNGASEVCARNRSFLAPVSFERDQGGSGIHTAASSPLDRGQRNSGDESVVHAGVECRRNRGEKVPGRRRRDVHCNGVDRVVDVDRGIEWARTDQRVIAVQDRFPYVEFDAPVAHVLDKPMRPSPERRSDLWQFGRDTGLELCCHRRQVGDQNAPRDAVDNQVMNHHK